MTVYRGPVGTYLAGGEAHGPTHNPVCTWPVWYRPSSLIPHPSSMQSLCPSLMPYISTRFYYSKKNRSRFPPCSAQQHFLRHLTLAEFGLFLFSKFSSGNRLLGCVTSGSFLNFSVIPYKLRIVSAGSLSIVERTNRRVNS